MNHSETVHPQPSVWLGALGVVVVLSFAALAVLATATGPSAADAAAVGGDSTSASNAMATDADAAASSAMNRGATWEREDDVCAAECAVPVPLYAGESGGHAPDAKPAVPPTPRVTGLFDPH